MQFSTLPISLFALSAAAQLSSFTDPKSNITTQSLFFGDGNRFGIVLPETVGTDFIAQIVGEGSGWTGISLGGAMTNSLLLTAWPSGTELQSSFRKVASYAAPPVANGSFTMRPIPSGTYVNSTHYSYTFLCSKCILDDGSTFAAGATSGVLGWAFSTTPPVNPSSSSTAFNIHQSQGNFGFTPADAKSTNYATWAALAEQAHLSGGTNKMQTG